MPGSISIGMAVLSAPGALIPAVRLRRSCCGVRISHTALEVPTYFHPRDILTGECAAIRAFDVVGESGGGCMHSPMCSRGRSWTSVVSRPAAEGPMVPNPRNRIRETLESLPATANCHRVPVHQPPHVFFLLRKLRTGNLNSETTAGSTSLCS